jgi:alkylated DNA nucleotide flippase Atl1
MDSERLHAIIAAIPSGRWASYGDVADALGARGFRAAVSLNQRLCDMQPDAAHRVLRSDGRVGQDALGDPDGVRIKLEAEGIAFDKLGRAPQDTRLRTAELLDRAGLEPVVHAERTADAEAESEAEAAPAG